MVPDIGLNDAGLVGGKGANLGQAHPVRVSGTTRLRPNERCLPGRNACVRCPSWRRPHRDCRRARPHRVDPVRTAGVIRTDTLRELLDAARLLTSQPLPRGKWVGVVGNGRLNVLAADAAQASGLGIPELSPHHSEGRSRARHRSRDR